jgi:hypothetical protein
MAKNLHVLILGFDAQRLVKPLSSGVFSPDRVILLRDERDPDTHEATSPHEELIADAYTTVDQDLNHYLDINVEEKRRPLFTDFAQVYRSFYEFLNEYGTGWDVTFNLSAAPKSTVLALQAARATWVSEHPRQDRTIELYYFEPDRYLETEVRSKLTHLVDQVDTLARERTRFSSNAQSELIESLTDPVEDAVRRVKRRRDEVEQYIDEVDEDPAATADESDDNGPFDLFTDAVDDVTSAVDDLIGDDEEPSDELNELEAYLSKCKDLSREIEEDPIRTVNAFRQWSERRFAAHTVPDRVAEPLRKAINDLEARVRTMVKTRDTLKTELQSFHLEIDRTEQAANRAEDLLDTIDRTGMTEGIHSRAEKWNIPQPPTADLRDVEQIILYVLERQGAQRSVQALARATAKELRKLAEELGAYPDDVEMDTELKNCCVRIESNSEIGDDFEEYLADKLRNRLQYNLQSLADQGYIHRRRPDEEERDRRRVQTELSSTGALWTEVHDTSEIRRSAVEEELREQLQQFVDD